MARLTFVSRGRVVRAVPATIHRITSTAWARQVAALGQGLASCALRWAAVHRRMVWAMDSGLDDCSAGGVREGSEEQ